ncbi:PREDICTED: 39S ribosomal protein L11, mitochondrial [Dufourea novaeangliae]|uniref:Large ribosomal subunit protein uL11m n=1 Tax=Dufourea novaeangliae TaxID=178035 RepID=A0A154P3P3_DUFNO|nr:PREDICTED: 39S ribosomal protein L11, mitochondrial [Dufourea novaeangliae]KZC06453.1 39S ribosomal protein L11, mitochondrial [Dufourea novaeangliae]
MSKAVGKGRSMKKVLQKIDHSSRLRVNIPARMANAKPPLGSQLGQRNINVVNFCKEFNTRTENIKQGIPLPCRVKVKPDRSFELVIHNPPATFFLKQAAGIERGKMCKGEIAGKITFKHLYEIACIKAQDPPLALLSLPHICQMMVMIARSCGIQVVRELDPVEYEQFMKEREENVQARLEEMRLSREAKLLRTV